MHTYTSVYIFLYIFLYVCMCICMPYMHVHIPTYRRCIYIHIYICMPYMHMYIFLRTCIHIHVHAYIYVHQLICIWIYRSLHLLLRIPPPTGGGRGGGSEVILRLDGMEILKTTVEHLSTECDASSEVHRVVSVLCDTHVGQDSFLFWWVSCCIATQDP